jgi:adenine-specific DNA-methyltransferase
MIKDTLNQNEKTQANSKQMTVLKEHFPACFKADGSFDIERFTTEISDKTNVLKEGYELKFLGKSYAKLLASTDTTTIIQPNEAHNALPENANSENIYISGDNLDGLKHLLKSYSKSIKCIYIDPPYNTGTDGFVYQDNFNYTRESLQEKLGVSEEEAERILELTKRGSASHSAWLMFMYSRLMLARDLLTNDGVIFISIDNNEHANLKLICDDIFGEENFIENFLWTKTSTPPSLSTKSRKTTEYVLCYERSRNDYKYNGDILLGGDQPLLNTGNAIRSLVFPKDKISFNKNKFPNGKYISQRPDRVALKNEIIITNGAPDRDVILEGPFKWDDKNLKNELDSGTTFIIKSELFAIRFINTKEGFKRPKNHIHDSVTTPLLNKENQKIGTNENASSEIEEIFGKRVFDFTKPTSLISYLVNFIVQENDIICDFFSGSATTAHAVMKLNVIDEKKRKFISVQLPEVLNPDLDSQKIALEFLMQNDLPLTLDYLGFERMKRAAAKIKEDYPEKKLDLGFKHYILAEPSQNTLDKLESFDNAGMLADTSILEDFGKSTILATWLNSDGYGLTVKPQEVDLAGYTGYYCQKHLYLIDSGFTLESMKALVSKYDMVGHFNPENLVLFGYSFPDWSINEMVEKNLRILNDGEKNLKINFSVRY